MAKIGLGGEARVRSALSCWLIAGALAGCSSATKDAAPTIEDTPAGDAATTPDAGGDAPSDGATDAADAADATDATVDAVDSGNDGADAGIDAADTGAEADAGDAAIGLFDAGAGDAGDGAVDAATDAAAGDAALDAGTDAPDAATFEPVAPSVYVNKVKNLLTGYAATQAEIDAVTANPGAFRSEVDGWLQQPEAQQVVYQFFRMSFQQTQISTGSFGDQLNYFNTADYNNATGQALTQAFQDSFARTAWQMLFVDGRKFDEVLQTRTYMMTTAMLSSMLFFERNTGSYGSGSVYGNVYASELAGMVVVNGSPVPITDTLDPNSPNYLHWAINQATPCGNAILGQGNHSEASSSLFQLLFGITGTLNNVDGTNKAIPPTGQPVTYCNIKTASPQYAASDLTDWRMVTFRDLNAGENPTRFWDLPTLRAASTTQPLPLRTQRVGPFTTPAFFANWSTNANNQNRVTMNQTLVVMIGDSFDGSDSSAVVTGGVLSGQDVTGSDAAHTTNPGCATCHSALDPMRRFFTQTYSYSMQVQTDPTLQNVYGSFDYGGVKQLGNSMYDLAAILASHPSMPAAWVQKVCYWASSAKCSENDPEFMRIEQAFASSLDFRTMVLNVLSSPMVTGATATKTLADRGEVISISRLDHWCTTLNNRLGLTNACTVNGTSTSVSPNVPTDGYSRGLTEPFQPTEPTMFTRGAVEQMCWQLASKLVDIPATQGTSRYSSKAAVVGIADMITTVMGIPATDARFNDIQSLLHNHFADAVVGGATPTQAMQSTFTLACTSPTSVSIGL